MMSTDEKQEAVRPHSLNVPKTNAEAAAFPHTTTSIDGNVKSTLTQHGLTKRELFAGMAMQGLLTDSGLKKSVYELAKGEGQSPEQYISDMAVEHADALLAALEARHDG